jgi:endogenous inhibitor of DNA gyrase (YacG/DUF329 family)
MAAKAKGSAKVIPLKGRRCPVCRKPTAETWRPFCSKHCADIDLGRWLGESYRIASREEADEDDVPDDER